MSRKSVTRIILAILAGYLADGVLVAATERLFGILVPGVDITPPRYYFIVDLLTQCLYTVMGGYLCCLIARSQRVAMAGLISLGLGVGTLSLIGSWNGEPRWYGITLLLVYPPCAWIGWIVRDSVTRS